MLTAYLQAAHMDGCGWLAHNFWMNAVVWCLLMWSWRLLHVSAGEGTLSITQTASYAVFNPLPCWCRWIDWLNVAPQSVSQSVSHTHWHRHTGISCLFFSLLSLSLSLLMQCLPPAFCWLHMQHGMVTGVSNVPMYPDHLNLFFFFFSTN